MSVSPDLKDKSPHKNRKSSALNFGKPITKKPASTQDSKYLWNIRSPKKVRLICCLMGIFFA